MTSLDNLIKCPQGTQFWILHLGYLEVDKAFLCRGANTSTQSNPKPDHQREKGQLYAILIKHPTAGLILWETGAGYDYPKVWGPPVNDIFARTDYEPSQELDKQVEATGHKMSDISMVIMGHLHLDHAGGLEQFVGTQVPIYAHELELKNAYYSLATGTDPGVYLGHYMKLELNWIPVHGSSLEIAQGLTVRHAPGHTDGLMILQVNLPESGTWIATTDMYLIKENFEQNVPLGWLGRDHNAWCRSNQMIHQLQRRTDAKMLFGHDAGTIAQYKVAPHAYT
ncbi:MAG: hypothetical protein M1828_004150 [Chrysothrix sp. TS-e1954]|nr:MAG: hypothetical protein M1828_004150 [Chrysothrix sp. TS-e1954]